MRQTILIAAVLFSTAAFAQGPTPPKTPLDQDTLISAEQLKTLLENAPIAKDTGKPGSLSAQLFGGSKFGCAFIRINEPDKAHAHGAISEVLVIQSGAGTLETGGEMVGPFDSNSDVHTAFFVNGPRPNAGAAPGAGTGGPHDGSGSAIAGGRSQKVKAGDVILVPAGVPHHWTAIDQPVVYLDIKFPKTE